jgi:hypothetical protein
LPEQQCHWCGAGDILVQGQVDFVLTRSVDKRAQQETVGEGTYWFLGLLLSFNFANMNLMKRGFKIK